MTETTSILDFSLDNPRLVVGNPANIYINDVPLSTWLERIEALEREVAALKARVGVDDAAK